MINPFREDNFLNYTGICIEFYMDWDTESTGSNEKRIVWKARRKHSSWVKNQPYVIVRRMLQNGSIYSAVEFDRFISELGYVKKPKSKKRKGTGK